MAKLSKLTKKELRIQKALGILPEEYRNALCRYVTPSISKGTRKCHLCGMKTIHKNDEFYLIPIGTGNYGSITINICKTCSWLSMQTIDRITNEYNDANQPTETKEK